MEIREFVNGKEVVFEDVKWSDEVCVWREKNSGVEVRIEKSVFEVRMFGELNEMLRFCEKCERKDNCVEDRFELMKGVSIKVLVDLLVEGFVENNMVAN